MASFIGAALRLMFQRKPREGHTVDEEHGVENGATSTAGYGSNTMTSSLGGNTAYVPPGHRSYRVTEEDPLVLFRLMVGISTSPYLGYSQSSPVGTRAAPNIGIYSRVIHAEQKAKDSFKVFSILINVCYFLQIVVAASITAMGAAGVSHGAVTAFGAINTIIAGLLTFLKGSGLPGRFKYYGHEWKKIREFIEQRERDFSRAGCTLDVFEVVAAVDRMYNNTKREIEMNTPDNYTSVTGGLQFRNGSSERIAGVDTSKLDGLVHKLATGLETKAQDMTHHIKEQGRAVSGQVRGLEKTAVETVEDKTENLNREARDRSAQVVQAVDDTQRAVIDEKERMQQAGVQAARDIDDTHRTAIGEMRSAASEQMRRVADRLGHHHDSRHEEDHKETKP